MNNIIIRDAEIKDAESICEIYNYYAQNTCVTFETREINAAEIENKIKSAAGAKLPFYAAVCKNTVAGFIYLSKWNSKSAYDMTKEITIYLRKEYTGKGIGSALYKKLLSNLDPQSVHCVIAVIYIPNPESVKLNEKFGFKQVSHIKEAGFKFGKWRDIGHWQLILNRRP
ncbi:MAG: GNAT family N-acetyltransferase [Endomicrobium sp.]|nr:GNAT family N-acetyltransferase [Endomicrobium sp.]